MPRILILDDQPSMAGMTALMTAMLDYEVVQCHLPAEACAGCEMSPSICS